MPTIFHARTYHCVLFTPGRCDIIHNTTPPHLEVDTGGPLTHVKLQGRRPWCRPVQPVSPDLITYLQTNRLVWKIWSSHSIRSDNCYLQTNRLVWKIWSSHSIRSDNCYLQTNRLVLKIWSSHSIRRTSHVKFATREQNLCPAFFHWVHSKTQLSHSFCRETIPLYVGPQVSIFASDVSQKWAGLILCKTTGVMFSSQTWGANLV